MIIIIKGDSYTKALLIRCLLRVVILYYRYLCYHFIIINYV